MTLILMRHATRDFNDDDALSTEGHRLAQTLAQVLRDRGHIPTSLFTSPKLRTRATLRPISEELGKKVVIDPRLDERDHRESVQDFENRVMSYCAEAATDRDETWVACSHLDWLEYAAQSLPSDENDFERSEPWPPMAIRIYVLNDGIWKREQGKS